MRHLLLLLVLLTLTIRVDAAPHLGTSNPQPIALSFVSTRCIEFAQVKVGPKETDATECVVMDFGIIGKKANQTYYYALYCLTPNSSAPAERCGQRMQRSDYYRTDGLAIFVQDGQSPDVQPLLDRTDVEIGMYNYGRPAFISGPGGEFMVVPIQLTGTGNGNASEYYSWDGHAWQPLDTKAWLSELSHRLPKDLEIWKGVWPDLRSMRATASLYRRSDGNCCPTGGTALIELAVAHQQLTLKTIEFVKERIDPIVDDSAFRRSPAEVAPTPTPPVAHYPSLQQPLIITSWVSNGFGVVEELTGQYRLEGNILTIRAESLKLRQVIPCAEHCVTVKSVRVELYGTSSPTSFFDVARSAPLPVEKTFEGDAVMVLGSPVFELTLPAGLDLAKLWLGLSIENTEGGTYYAHTQRNLFARGLYASGLAGDPCGNVKGIEQAIKTHCHQVLEQELDHWYRPLVAWWEHFTDGPRPALVALREDDVEAIRLLGLHGTNMDTPDESGSSPLMIATGNRSVVLVQALLKAGAKVNYAVIPDNPQRSRTALHTALYTGSEEIIKLLLDAGASTDKADRHDWLPVHYAAYLDSPASLALLKAHRASLESTTTTDRGETPLMLAAQYGKLAAMRYLLAQGINTTTQDRYGKNAYDYAVFFKQTAAIELLRPQ